MQPRTPRTHLGLVARGDAHPPAPAAAARRPTPRLVRGSRVSSQTPSRRAARPKYSGTMDSTKSWARWAGLLYGIASSLAPFAYLYVPDQLTGQGDALATAHPLRASEGLRRAATRPAPRRLTVLLCAALAL